MQCAAGPHSNEPRCGQRKDKWSRPSDTSGVKSELRIEATLTPNTPNLDPTLTPNTPNYSDEPGGSNIIYLTDLYVAVRANLHVSSYVFLSEPASSSSFCTWRTNKDFVYLAVS